MTMDEQLADAAAIDALYEALPRAAMSGDPAAYAAVFTADAVIMQPGAPPAAGRAAVERWARAVLRDWVVEIAELDLEPVELGGTLAWRRYTGNGHYRPTAGGPPVPFDQKYLDVLRRDTDSAWRFALHMWSSNNGDGSIWH